MEHIFSPKVDHYIYLLKTDSTNQFAQNVISKNNPVDNYCIYTDNQTKGRGQIDRFWSSEASKNLTVSYIFQLLLEANKQFNLNMSFALAIVRFLELFLETTLLSIKWPNDIYYENKKIAGILIQNYIRGSSINQTILGVGININQNIFNTKIPNPVSLKQITGKEYDLRQLLFLLEKEVLDSLSEMHKNQESQKTKYLYKLFGNHKIRQFKCLKTDEIFDARIEGVSEEGKLLLDKSGVKNSYNFREIKYII